MARIARKTQKIFAGSASNNGQFGSGQTGAKVLSNDLDVIQSLAAWGTGWLQAVLGTKKFPPLEEFQSCNYVNTYQLAYQFQEGIPEYDSGTTYFTFSLVKKAGTAQLYRSLTDTNVGNALTDATKWKFLIDLDVPSIIPQATETVLGVTKIATFAQAAAGTDDATTITPYKLAAYRVPTGAGMDFWGTSAPGGYIFPYGQIANVADFPALGALFGSTYGGNGSTTFGLPDKRGRASFGKDDMGGSPAGRLSGQPGGINGLILGGAGGAEARSLNSGNLPSFEIDIPGNDFGFTGSSPNRRIGLGPGSAGNTSVPAFFSGGASPFTTLPPGIVCNYIIKT